jgi:hypothetical protein
MDRSLPKKLPKHKSEGDSMKIEAAGSSEMYVNLPNYTASHAKLLYSV